MAKSQGHKACAASQIDLPKMVSQMETWFEKIWMKFHTKPMQPQLCFSTILDLTRACLDH